MAAKKVEREAFSDVFPDRAAIEDCILISMLRIVELSGDYYDCGKQFGLACKDNIQSRLNKEITPALVEQHKEILQEVDTRYRELYPDYCKELEGVAAGSETDYWALLLLNTSEILERTAGCTSIAVATDTQKYLVHNEDGDAQERTEDCFLLHYTLKDSSFYAFTYAGELPGGSYSWNSSHLYFSVNYLKPIDPDMHGRVSRNFLARKAIEAKNIDEAIALFKSYDDASGYHYYMGQGDGFVSIENFHTQVSVKEVQGIDAHSNHYLHPDFIGKVEHKQHTQMRIDRAQQLIKEGTDPLRVLADRANAPLSICTEPNEALHTISTIGFFPKEKKVILYEPELLKEESSFVL